MCHSGRSEGFCSGFQSPEEGRSVQGPKCCECGSGDGDGGSGNVNNASNHNNSFQRYRQLFTHVCHSFEGLFALGSITIIDTKCLLF